MPRPRYSQIALDHTPYYHCVSRCVRQAFLCGKDLRLGRSYEHRRQWVEDRLHTLSGIFSIDLCAYAVMSNHYHVVLHVDRSLADSWNKAEVIRRWHRLFKGSALSCRYVSNDPLLPAEIQVLDVQVDTWRDRLSNISWFMRVLNESIARQANAEDGCSGRFWEGRFKSQALLDEAALATCMAYVDLNPVRARLADTPEQSEYTSIKQRCKQARTAYLPSHPLQQGKGLMPFAGNPRDNMPRGLPFRLSDYMQLIDWSGRIMRADKPGYISSNLPDILARLNMQPGHWAYLMNHFESPFKGMIGRAYALKQVCEQRGYLRAPGLGACAKYLSPG